MFIYHPPKSRNWGSMLRTKDPLKAKQMCDAFFEKYFDRVEDPDPYAMLEFKWKSNALPKIEWPEEYLKPGYEHWKRIFVMGMGYRVMFMMGLPIPISPTEPASYEFLGRFSADAPFKMIPEHFSVVAPSGKKGKCVCGKPSGDIATRLNDALLHADRAA
jgi:hypothetical protein